MTPHHARLRTRPRPDARSARPALRGLMALLLPLGALGDELAESGEILSDGIERLGGVRQFEEGAGVASGDA